MRSFAWCSCLLVLACGSESSELPTALPFQFDRPGVEALPLAETEALTRSVLELLDRVGYFEWVHRVSHGMHTSTGKPDYLLWWHDVEAVKAGNTVTFRHGMTGGGHNIYIPSSKVLQAAAAGYVLTRDPRMGAVAEQFSKGLSAACRGLVFDENDPHLHLMARNFVAQNHSFKLDETRQKAVDFTPWYTTYEEWNAHRVHFTRNPYWGDIFVTNMRSKDDVPHIYLSAIILRWLAARADDAAVRDAANLGLDCARGFAKDIVDSGYKIRTKDAEGRPYVPDQDLASFVQYESIVPNGECAAKLTSALLGYGDARGNSCGFADRTDYEGIAVATHYYNYAIVEGFHLSATFAALADRDDAAASALLRGLALRADRYLDPGSDEPGREHPRWDSDRAVFLLHAAALGMPLELAEARLIAAEVSKAVEHYGRWTNWDLWSLADGVYGSNGGYLPSDEGRLIPPEDIAQIYTYCFSPFRARQGAIPFDCSMIH